MAVGFVPRTFQPPQYSLARRQQQLPTVTWSTESNEAVDGDKANMDIDFLFEEDEEAPSKEDAFDVQEKAWRFAKKPLLHIGSKGATHSHGNSLRQLLDDHTVVKVKVNTKKFGGA
jgi:hypothetical protein